MSAIFPLKDKTENKQLSVNVLWIRATDENTSFFFFFLGLFLTRTVADVDRAQVTHFLCQFAQLL